VNIADYLTEMARRQPYMPAVFCPAGNDARGRVRYTHYTYSQLDAASDELAAGFAAIGIERGVRTALMAPPSLDFFALVFALFKVRAVMVCVDPGLGVKNLGRCLAEAKLEAFVGVPKAHWARRLLGWGRRTIRQNVVTGARRGWGLGITLDLVTELGRKGMRTSPQGAADAATRDDDVAAILFTSGSTGAPKGVVYTHAHFDAQLRALRDLYDIRPGEIDLATFPLFALYAPALGMTAVVPDMDFTRPGDVDPRRLARAIEDFGVTNLFGSPALLDRFSRWGVDVGARFATLRRVTSAGAPAQARIIERMTRLLAPGVQVFTPYGATEALPVASIGSDEILGETQHQTRRGRGVCVGRLVGDVCARIARIVDGPIERWSDELAAPPGEVGEIIVSGPAVTASYHGRPDATKLAKISDPQTASGSWHRMGDLGYFDESGRLWFCGRKSQRVTTPSGDLYTIPCEGVFNAHPAVRRTALVGVAAGVNGNARAAARPVLCVELLDAPQQAPDAIRGELLQLGSQFAHTRQVQDVLFHPAFPVDIRHNAKIGREELGRWAARKLGTSPQSGAAG